MERDKPDHSEEEGVVHTDPATDAALNWLFTLQVEPHDRQLRAAFEAWRQADAANAQAFAAVAEAWELPEMDMVAAEVAVRAGHVAPNRKPVAIDGRRRKGNVWSRAVLAVAAAIVIAVAVQQYPALMLRWQADYITATGMRDEIMLPDGSRMVLNTASAVALDFEGGRRAVSLLGGEAFFDVVPDPARPFTVAAAFSSVEVKGTAFSVRTENDQDIVVLERGHVDVTRQAAPVEKVALEPGESVTATETRFSAVEKTDPATALAWLKGRVFFRDRPFGEVLQEIGRYYSSPVIFADTRLRQVRINGNYRLDDPERAIRSLATAAGASVTRLPGGILILR
ncbi:FecR domain-containing protein [Aquamicrobium sp. NLF2-7]|uniref:FecR family protein n=1 Tax=Aquamicrobium sp. NLF2-7 TaxID=2918753 RepID=UPI001EFBAEAF|nr:FecR domain-containing protein [Aquamicrobium sp. NLF2-7]